MDKQPINIINKEIKISKNQKRILKKVLFNNNKAFNQQISQNSRYNHFKKINYKCLLQCQAKIINSKTNLFFKMNKAWQDNSK